ncbi:MAG: hypothetical protein AB1649_22160, partial [Chloroflexota bacterium]
MKDESFHPSSFISHLSIFMLPTLRGILVLLLAAPIIALGTWLRAMEWVGWFYAVLVLVLFYMDWSLAGRVDRFEVARHHDTKLSLGVDNPVTVSVRNRSRRGTS